MVSSLQIQTQQGVVFIIWPRLYISHQHKHLLHICVNWFYFLISNVSQLVWFSTPYICYFLMLLQHSKVFYIFGWRFNVLPPCFTVFFKCFSIYALVANQKSALFIFCIHCWLIASHNNCLYIEPQARIIQVFFSFHWSTTYGYDTTYKWLF